MLTDLVALVRFALDQDDELVPIALRRSASAATTAPHELVSQEIPHELVSQANDARQQRPDCEQRVMIGAGEPVTQAYLDATPWGMDIAGRSHPAVASIRPLYDPKILTARQHRLRLDPCLSGVIHPAEQVAVSVCGAGRPEQAHFSYLQVRGRVPVTSISGDGRT
jgi:hypothetical protein